MVWPVMGSVNTGLPVSQHGVEPDEVLGGCEAADVTDVTSLGELIWLTEDAGVALIVEFVDVGVDALGMVNCKSNKIVSHN